MTELQILNAINAPIADLFAPYSFIIDNQDDACELNSDDTQKLIDLCDKIPTISMIDVSSTNLRIRYASKSVFESNNESFLYVEIDQITSDKFYVTSFVDDIDCLRDYYPNI